MFNFNFKKKKKKGYDETFPCGTNMDLRNEFLLSKEGQLHPAPIFMTLSADGQLWSFVVTRSIDELVPFMEKMAQEPNTYFTQKTNNKYQPQQTQHQTYEPDKSLGN